MRTVVIPDGPSPSDLTARARIREVAIECFAEDGFDVPMRTIAARAEVSLGLITHHFGSKAALRTECDAEVLRRYHALKTEAIADPSGYLLARLTAPGAAVSILVYILRAIHAGGRPARTFLESLVEQSLLVRREIDGRSRFVALDTLRAFAAERLAERGALDAARDRHADYVVGTAEEASADLRGPHPAAGARTGPPARRGRRSRPRCG